VTVGPVHALVLDLPTLPGDDPPVLQHLAVFADPWPGPVAVWRSRDGASYELLATATAPTIMGETLDDLPRGPTSRWDRASSARVRLYGGALSSVSDQRVLGGANAAALRRPDGAWEIIQFANATLVGARTYQLSRLLRGVLGSEWAMDDPLPAGAPFVLLDRHVLPLARGLDALGRTLQLRIVAASRDHGDPAAVTITTTPGPTALKPLAPVHLRARRDTDGVHVSWRPRKRGLAGVTFAARVPSAEAIEAYELDILSGSTVVRTLSASDTAALYAAADEIADFGSPQTSLSVRLYRLSATVGRGFPAIATLSL
jgi:hypothetical protein